MNLTLGDCRKHIDFLKSSLDQKWLTKKFADIDEFYKKEKTKNKEMDEKDLHPLSYLIYRAEKHLENSNKNPKIKISSEIVYATLLGIYLDRLKTSNVEGLNDKINELTSHNFEQFEKTVFELATASALTKTNHAVRFVKTESEKRTFDMLVDNKIEIECKKKDRLTQRDRKGIELWEKLNKKLIKLMNSTKRYYFVYILLKTEPSSKIIKNILRIIRKSVIKNRNDKIQNNSADIITQKICDYNENFMLDETANTEAELFNFDIYSKIENIVKSRIEDKDLLDYSKTLPDFDVLQPRITKFSDGKLATGEIMRFIFKTLDIPDRVKSILSSINNAKKQLTGEQCSIICIDVTNMVDRLSNKDLNSFSFLFENQLKDNTSISAIAILSENHTVDGGGVRFQHIASVIRNKSAKYPLSEDFVIINQ